MTTLHKLQKYALRTALSLLVLAAPFSLKAEDGSAAKNPVVDIATLAKSLSIGDAVFIRISAKPFREVAATTASWTNHVGVVVSVSGDEVVIGESTFPISRSTTLRKFIARSEHGRVAVGRLLQPLTDEQEKRLVVAVDKRAGVLYDTGFDLHSSRQFCSRYVHEVLLEATGVSVGEVETFSTLLSRNPATNLGFWKLWYFGKIPWGRETISPASLLRSAELRWAFDGVATNSR